jgi:putative DNA primase/helicase
VTKRPDKRLEVVPDVPGERFVTVDVDDFDERRRLADHGNAQRLIDHHGADLRYVPALGWHSWDETRWLRDTTGETVRKARELVEQLYAEADRAAEEGGEGGDKAKALRAHAKTSASRRGVEGMIALARSDRRVVLDVSELDADPYLLNAPNGTIDLRTGELGPHERADLITRRTAVPFDPEAEAPVWRRFLETVLSDAAVRGYVQRMTGQAAIGANLDELFHVLHGSGANGKTKFAETVATALGDYAATRDAQLFLSDRREPAARPELVSLRGVRLLVASETDQDRRLSTALVKALTGGDTIAARLLYANEIVEFVPAFSPWLRTNHRPAIREQSEAVWRRVRLVPFTVTIPKEEQDRQLQNRLNAELVGVLAWIVEGARDYLDLGLDPPDGIVAATDAYRAEENVLGAFISDRCLTGPNLSVPVGPLFDAWKAWAEANGERPGTATSFGRTLTDAGYPSERDTQGRRVRRGIALAGALDEALGREAP